MRRVTFAEISTMEGNGSSMRHVLRYFIDKGAMVYVLHEERRRVVERFFLVQYEELMIPLRAYDLKFYSVLNSGFSRIITHDKLMSGLLLDQWQIPTPQTVLYEEQQIGSAFLAQYGSCVVKPREGAHGDGITVGVDNEEKLSKAVERARAIHPEVLLQPTVPGEDHRLLFIDYKFVAAVKRRPASAIGDGQHTVRQLVEASNKELANLVKHIRAGDTEADTAKGSISQTPIKEIADARGKQFLEIVPPAGERVQLVDKANVSLGGQTIDMTDEIPVELTDKLALMLRNLALPLCGVDVLSMDITSAIADQKSFVIELNDAPGLRLHELPAEGMSRPVCGMVAESLIRYHRSSY